MTPDTPTARPTLTLAARAWSHLMPLARGSVAPERFDLRVDLRDTTPDPHSEPVTTVAETSLSGYVRGLVAGDDRRIGLPVFVMRGFRHRCLLVRRDSDLKRIEDLRGATVGATGWPDSGNTWTRSLLRRAGIDLTENTWKLASLTGGALEPARLGPLPGNVSVTGDGRPLLALLTAGEVDAVMAPFIPQGVHRPDSPVRHLLTDYPGEEAAYLTDVGFVPGIHVLTLHRGVVEQFPWLPGELVATLQRSKDAWDTERWHYADTTPWLLRDLQDAEAAAGSDWSPYGVAANAAMVAHFCTELHEQGLVSTPVDPAFVFADYQNLTENHHERTRV